MKLITNIRRIEKEMLNQGLLETNSSFSFLYLASSARPWPENGRTSRTARPSTGRWTSVDRSTPAPSSGKRGKTRGKWGEMRVKAIAKVLGDE